MNPTLLKFVALSVAFVSIQSIYAQCELFTLDFGNPSTFATSCGTLGGFWIASEEEFCTITFTAFILPGDSTVDPNMDIPLSNRFHPTGNCDDNDTAFIQYSLNGGPYMQAGFYTGDDMSGVTMMYDTIKDVPGGAMLEVRIEFVPNIGCTNWKLRSGDCSGNPPECTCISWPLETGTTTFFSPFGSLPITLISFEARIIEDEIKLTWVTSVEIDNDFFTIERSTNGMFYDEIAEVDAIGNSTLNTSYEAWDEFPVEGSAYYRLTQTDEDGTSEAVGTLSLKYDPNASVEGGTCEFDIRPNPCPGQCNLDLIGCTNSDFISVGLYDAMGRRISSSIPIKKGNGFYLNTRNNLAPGTYIVMGSTNKEKVSQKIIVQ